MMNSLKYLLFAALLAFSITSCDDAMLLSSEDAVRTTDQLRIELSIQSDEISKLQDIRAEYTIINISGQEISFDFSSGCQYAYLISKGKNVLFDQRAHTGCTQALTSFTLQPEESKTFGISLEGFEVGGSLDSGSYALTAFLRDDNNAEITATFMVQ